MRLSGRRAVVLIVLLPVAALVVDRAALAIWKWRVHRFYETLRQEAALSLSDRQALWEHGNWKVLNVAAPQPGLKSPYPVALTELALSRPDAVAPSQIVVDGVGGLHLRYLPPRLAWSTRLARDSRTGRRSWVRLFEQGYTISIQWYGPTPRSPRPAHPFVELRHGLPP
jgi:hypothetical protein